MEVKTTERENGTRRVQMNTGSKSRVEQSHKKECNINTIVAKAHKTGLFPQRLDVPKYGDFTTAVDFHQAKNSIHQANDDFMSLPSEIRNRFENDPGKLLDFINDPDNSKEAVKLGLLQGPAEPEIAAPAESEKPPEQEEKSDELEKVEDKEQ